MKKVAFIFILILANFITNAQSDMIKDVFRLLPADKVYDLTVATRDSMLQGKIYYPADNDTDQVAAYNYGSSEIVKDYLYISLGFETGQRGFGMIEIRSFKKKNGDNLILVSQSGGVANVSYGQHDISAFIYSKNKKLIPYKNKVLPTADEMIFMKPGIPDSLKQVVINNSNMAFDLSNEKLTLDLRSDYISTNEVLRKWLKGDIIYFDWINDRFVISKMEFEFIE